ncbi:hypothetical protein NDU88_000005 [Pleurodeles waltl]|uniref:Uncharacterized protein n=1 Tax=Pleurodeles waltl TaxID=8319 RepID=A0AAV7KLC1_PLEWA|nr:hypothetical protein NDU88_000005 [Pleurodeles waltl]
MPRKWRPPVLLPRVGLMGQPTAPASPRATLRDPRDRSRQVWHCLQLSRRARRPKEATRRCSAATLVPGFWTACQAAGVLLLRRHQESLVEAQKGLCRSPAGLPKPRP